MKTKAGQRGSYGDGKKLNTEGTEFGHRGHREENEPVIYTRGSLMEAIRSEMTS